VDRSFFIVVNGKWLLEGPSNAKRLSVQALRKAAASVLLLRIREGPGRITSQGYPATLGES
jgi:hypothetical protein